MSASDERCYAPLDGKDINLIRVVRMTYDRMALLTAWNALLLGILYLAVQVFQFIFDEQGFRAD
ncbi:hypothetical protein FIBSPDRAFT_952271 [Athelia psychrophila]|uniref:Uncharacterized protein n=1 Tax=Athelia psychrophila TaxID=1759441 RepID=A0A166LQB9_9AGAM|nr:hypothetical protein FIBSPDRAFT_952271 [Fibularhizoctonia sp. CBS 109695]